MNNRKLLYITNGINGSGGLERVLSIKASYLADKLDNEIHILVLNDTYINPFYAFSPKIKFHSIKVSGNPIKYFFNYRRGIKSIIREVQPDVISVCDDGLKGLLFPLIFGKKIPLIYERHASFDIFKKKSSSKNIFLSLKKRIAHYGAKQYNKFIVLTESNIEEWKLSNIQVIPNPLPFYPNRSSTLTQKKIIAVGSHSYNKGFDRLVKIWSNVHNRYPEWQLEIYGKHDERSEIIKLIRDYNLTSVVHLFQPVSNIMEKYLEASIFVLPSRSEGFGMVLIEAMACGVPVISFDCPSGPRDIIHNNVDGFLISDGNLSDFEQKLLSLMDSIDLRKKMGAAARENVKRFTIENIVKKWENLFNELLDK